MSTPATPVRSLSLDPRDARARRALAERLTGLSPEEAEWAAGMWLSLARDRWAPARDVLRALFSLSEREWSFLSELANRPNDDAALVYCDWLKDERRERAAGAVLGEYRRRCVCEFGPGGLSVECAFHQDERLKSVRGALALAASRVEAASPRVGEDRAAALAREIRALGTRRERPDP